MQSAQVTRVTRTGLRRYPPPIALRIASGRDAGSESAMLRSHQSTQFIPHGDHLLNGVQHVVYAAGHVHAGAA